MNKQLNWSLYGAVLSLNFVTLNSGGSYSWTSPVLPKLNATEHNPFGRQITTLEQSWITSILSLGASIGPFLAGAILDKIGRKKTMLLVSIPLMVSYMIMAFATNIGLYYFSRFFLGLGVGSLLAVIPIYVGEIAEDANRGALGCVVSIMSRAGSLFSYLVGPFVSIRILCLLFLLPTLIFLFSFGLFVPDSPYYLLMVDKEVEATAALVKLRKGPVEKELEEMKKNVERSRSNQVKLGDLMQSRAVRKGLLIGSGLMFFQQASGITAFLSYMQSIFEASGSELGPETSAAIIGGIQLCVTFLTTRLIDRLGRRILLMTSLVGLLLSNLLLGLYFYFKDNDYKELAVSLFWLPISSLILYVVMYTVGMGPVAWAMVGELFPPHVRATASTLISFVCLFMAFLLALFFPNLTHMIGMSKSLWIFAGCCLAGIFFVWSVVPETKGKSLHEIQVVLEGNKQM